MEARHTAARGLDTENAGHGFKNMFEVGTIESLRRTIYEIAASVT